jgi:hypothetical protein
VTDMTTPAANACWQQAGPLRDGGSVPCAPRWQPIARKLTTQLIDVLAEHRQRDLVTDPADHADPHDIRFPRRERHSAVGAGAHAILEYRLRQGTCARPDWPLGLTGIDSLSLTSPAEAYAAR